MVDTRIRNFSFIFRSEYNADARLLVSDFKVVINTSINVVVDAVRTVNSNALAVSELREPLKKKYSTEEVDTTGRLCKTTNLQLVYINPKLPRNGDGQTLKQRSLELLELRAIWNTLLIHGRRTTKINRNGISRLL